MRRTDGAKVAVAVSLNVLSAACGSLDCGVGVDDGVELAVGVLEGVGVDVSVAIGVAVGVGDAGRAVGMGEMIANASAGASCGGTKYTVAAIAAMKMTHSAQAIRVSHAAVLDMLMILLAKRSDCQ